MDKSGSNSFINLIVENFYANNKFFAGLFKPK